MALLLLLVVGVAGRDCLEERGCSDIGIRREEKVGECLEGEGGCLDTGGGKNCLEEEEGGCLDTGGGRECWEGLEAGLALRAWVLSEGGGERQEVMNSLSEVNIRKYEFLLGAVLRDCDQPVDDRRRSLVPGGWWMARSLLL